MLRTRSFDEDLSVFLDDISIKDFFTFRTETFGLFQKHFITRHWTR